jgi:ABC-type uncharacterized transport system auxiliary subunit
MRRMTSLILVSVVAILINGCGSGRPIHYYTMDLPPAPEPSTGAYPVTLLIGRINAPELLRDEPMVYRSGPNEIGTYQYHQWAEPPTEMVRDMLIRQLRASGKYQAVDRVGSSVSGEYVLHGKLYDFEEVDGSSIAALVSMEFELYDRKTGRTVWTHYYSHTTPVEGKQVPDVVSALNQDLAQGLRGLTSGLNAYFSLKLHGKSPGSVASRMH